MKKIFLMMLCGFMTATTVQAEPIADNSFLIEEAYNQEPGVIQFIQGAQYLNKARSTNYTFTSEIPMGSQEHQFSFVIPINKIDSSQSVDGSNIQGIGDIILNYRYQLMNTDSISITPRFSLILPTGDYKKGLGNSAMGLQFNQAVSIAISNKFVHHLNIGFTLTPDAQESGGAKATTASFNYGASLVYLLSDNFNLLCEVVGNSNESPKSGGGKTRQETLYVVPGFRFAVNFESGLQMVPGLAYMSGVGPSEGENGAFAYLSLEKKFW